MVSLGVSTNKKPSPKKLGVSLATEKMVAGIAPDIKAKFKVPSVQAPKPGPIVNKLLGNANLSSATKSLLQPLANEGVSPREVQEKALGAPGLSDEVKGLVKSIELPGGEKKPSFFETISEGTSNFTERVDSIPGLSPETKELVRGIQQPRAEEDKGKIFGDFDLTDVGEAGRTLIGIGTAIQEKGSKISEDFGGDKEKQKKIISTLTRGGTDEVLGGGATHGEVLTKGLTGTLSIPFLTTGEALEGYSEGKIVRPTESAIFGAISLTPVGAAFNFLFSQEGKLIEDVGTTFEWWAKQGDRVAEIPFLKKELDKRPELKEAFGVAWENSIFLLLHGAIKKVKPKAKLTAEEALRIMEDKSVIKEVKKKAGALTESIKKGDLKPLKEVFSPAALDDAFRFADEVADLKLAEFKGRSSKSTEINLSEDAFRDIIGKENFDNFVQRNLAEGNYKKFAIEELKPIETLKLEAATRGRGGGLVKVSKPVKPTIGKRLLGDTTSKRAITVRGRVINLSDPKNIPSSSRKVLTKVASGEANVIGAERLPDNVSSILNRLLEGGEPLSAKDFSILEKSPEFIANLKAQEVGGFASGPNLAVVPDAIVTDFAATRDFYDAKRAVREFDASKGKTAELEPIKGEVVGEQLSQGQAVLKRVEEIFKAPDKEKVKFSELGTKVEDFAAEVQQSMVSEFAPIKVLEKRVYAKEGEVRPVLDLARKFEQVKGAPARAEATIRVFADKVIKPVAKHYDDFEAFLFLKRTEARLKNNLKLKKVADFTLDDMTAGLDELRLKLGDKVFEKIKLQADVYQEFMDWNLRLQVGAGRMSEGLYKEIKKQNDFYAPFQVLQVLDSVDEAFRKTGQIATTRDLSKKIKGIDDEQFKLKSILGTSAELIYKSELLASKNLKMQALGDLVKLDVDGVYIKRLKKGKESGLMPKPRKGFDTVSYLDNGEHVVLEVPEVVAKSLQGKSPAQTGLTAKVLSLTASTFRTGAVVVNPAFQAVNLPFADIPRLAMISRFGVKNPVDAVRFPLDVAHAIITSATGNFGKPNRHYKAYLESGSANSTIARWLNADNYKVDVRPPTTLKGKVLDKVKRFSTLNTLTDLGNALEETSKLTGFMRGKKLVKKGKLSPEEMVTEVRNYSGSPDFFRSGQSARDMNLIFMFFNARVQGITADLTRLAVDPLRFKQPGKQKAALEAHARLAGIAIPITALHFLNQTEEFKSDYDQIPEWEKENYFMIPRDSFFKGDNGETIRDYWRIPKREVIKLYANLIENSIEFFGKREPDAMWNMAKEFLQDISPINYSGDNVKESVETMIGGMNPLIKGTYEITSGRDTFYHSSLVPEKLQGKSAANQFTNRTPKIYQKLGGVLNVSPIELEQMFNTLSGGIAKQFTIKEPAIDRAAWTTYPVIQRFVRGERSATPKEFKSMEKFIIYQEDEKAVLSREAEALFEELKDLDPAVANQRKNALKQLNPELHDKLESVMVDESRGLTYEERRVKNAMGVKNGARAIFIYSQLLQPLKTPEEKQALVDDYKKKKIISKTVEQQIARLVEMEKSGLPLPSIGVPEFGTTDDL